MRPEGPGGKINAYSARLKARAILKVTKFVAISQKCHLCVVNESRFKAQFLVLSVAYEYYIPGTRFAN
jgi:hypothetical protein